MLKKYKNKQEYLSKIEKFYTTNPKHVAGYFHEKIAEEIIRKLEPKNKKILDVGCGVGRLIWQINSLYPKNKFYGADITKNNIKTAKKNIKYAQFIVSDAENMPFKDNYFDIIFCTDSLEHFYSINNSLKEFNRILKDKGLLIICSPNYLNIIGLIKITFEALYISKPRSFSIDVFEQENENLVTYLNLKEKLEKNNLEIIGMKSLNFIQACIPGYDFFLDRMCSLHTSKKLRLIGKIGAKIYRFSKKVNRIIERLPILKYASSQIIYITKK